MNDIIETIEYKGYKIEINQSEFYDSPRDWDNLGKMVCWHSRYNIGDKHKYSNPDEFKKELAYEADESIDDRIEYWDSGNGWVYLSKKYDWQESNEESRIKVNDLISKIIIKHYIILSIYMYDHSGITINTTGFSCPWDSGQVGYIYVSKKEVKKEYNKTRLSKQLIKKVEDILKNEVNIYDQFIRGDVYDYSVVNPEDDESIDSCTGFYGSDWESNGLMEYAKNAIDCQVKQDIEKEFFSQFFF